MSAKSLQSPSDADRDKLSSIQLLLLDVDGVLTDGKIVYSDTGDEIKAFSVKDGLGIRLLMDSGIQVGIITGRRSKALVTRCRDLGIDLLYDGVRGSKRSLFETILSNLHISEAHAAFVGDDLPDLGVMKRCGLSFTVADAALEVKETANFITGQRGGDGAVREICEAILKAKNLWPSIVERFQNR